MPYALVAYRAQQPELSRLAFAAATGQAGEGAQFLDQAFAGRDAWHPRTAEEASAPAAPADADRNILIEAFLIRDTRNASMDKGINLLDSLARQFDGTLGNYSYEKETADATGHVPLTLPGNTHSLTHA